MDGDTEGQRLVSSRQSIATLAAVRPRLAGLEEMGLPVCRKMRKGGTWWLVS